MPVFVFLSHSSRSVSFYISHFLNLFLDLLDQFLSSGEERDIVESDLLVLKWLEIVEGLVEVLIISDWVLVKSLKSTKLSHSRLSRGITFCEEWSTENITMAGWLSWFDIHKLFIDSLKDAVTHQYCDTVNLEVISEGLVDIGVVNIDRVSAGIHLK